MVTAERGRYLFVITGEVQGIGFRYAVWQKARALGLVGFVRNRADGSVLIEAQGELKATEEFIMWVESGFDYPGPHHIFIEAKGLESQSSFEILV